MRRRGERAPREKAAAAAEEETKSAARKAEQGAEEYQCTGLLEQDFPELCARAGIAAVPKVTLRPPPSFPADEEPAEPTLAEVLARIASKYSYFQPCVQVEREHEDPRSVRAVFLRGWKIEEEMLGVLSQCLPALAGLQAVHLWKVGLTERLLPALATLLARCPRLRMLSLEGNPLPEPAFHILMGSDSTLAHLSLRNNSIGDAAARLIGQSLSTPSCSNRSLVSLVLSFNRISDLGAGYIAQGLRLNRSLLSLSLANNDIGDAGAVKLAERARSLPTSRKGRRLPGGCWHPELPSPPDPKRDRGPERASLQPARQRGPRQAAPGQARQSPRQEEGAAAEGGGQAAQEAAGAESRPQQRCKTERPGEAEHGGTGSGRAAAPAAGRGQASPGQRRPAGEPGAPQPQPDPQPHHRARPRRVPGGAGGAAAGEKAKGAGTAGAAVPVPGEPHPSHQPGIRTAPGAAAAAGPPPQSPGPGGGAGIGRLAGPRGATCAPAGEGELASWFLFKKKSKKSKSLPWKGRK
ncbi:leucine-rich repeat-containing protein 71 isoform X2 [Grus americana]|uniref:leucine-rich repeat-containing protein 71 isoform X2 n=1 Tax=Grus americana TaxID=9117 RepID=UPI002407F4EE|nr:leucine-rich repeat-containing protein 71 isoform X2 [Grus americana]